MTKIDYTMTNLDTMPFDPDTFMTETIDGPMETEFQLCPQGSFQAMIDDFDSTAFEVFSFTYKKGPKAGEPGQMTKFTVPFSIQDPKVLADLGRDKVIVTQQLILDRTPTGALDFGKDRNIALGRLREAVGQNQSGAWSPQQLRGAGPLMVHVTHERYVRKDGTKGDAVRVVRTTAIR